MGSRTEDLRVGIRLFAKRSFSHWNARYLWNRTRYEVWKRRHPTYPFLTADSIDLLARLLRPEDRGAEWGSGNSTGWFAERTAWLDSFETGAEYAGRVRENLRQRGLRNVRLEQIDYEDMTDEQAMLETPWVRSTEQFADGSLDYALVDSSPRGLLCHRAAQKVKPGGLLIVDNANWYLPPPATVAPAPSSVTVPAGSPGSKMPNTIYWPRFIELTAGWRRLWTSDGISMTLILFKPA
jgi:predicted O-methyltransferase YrrM